MGWIFMYPADDEESQRLVKLLRETGKCLFDLSKNGASLMPLAFGYQSHTDFERKYHSFVGETAYVRWETFQNRHLLRGHHFWWLCDCSEVK